MFSILHALAVFVADLIKSRSRLEVDDARLPERTGRQA